MKIQPLTLSDAEFIAHRYAVERMSFKNEPMPNFKSRKKGVLESCLAEPFQSFNGVYLHYRFERRAAVLFYMVIKNHPFDNGNKRMAVVLTSVFFFVNNRWLEIPDVELYKLATQVADSNPKNHDDVIGQLCVIFKRYTQALGSMRVKLAVTD